MNLNQYLESKNISSKFAARQSEQNGNIIFNNSGKRGVVEEFTLGLVSIISILNDILSNIDAFLPHEQYDETEWRVLGLDYFKDGSAKSMSKVQTKPLFSTLSKIIAWANMPFLEDINTDQFIRINREMLENTIIKLESLSKISTITPLKDEIEIPIEAQVIYSYLVESKSHRYIQENVLKLPAPSNGGGFEAMTILHGFEIREDKKGLIDSNNLNEAIASATGKYKDALNLLKQYYPNALNQTILTLKFDYNVFYDNYRSANLYIDKQYALRFISSLLTKPFVILTGLSGSGKTKLAQSFVQWISNNEDQYRIIPVGADWTNREPLLGYPNGLELDKYVAPDSGVLQLLIHASEPKNNHKPYFIILDEMNLSHVERYFADFLSIMESNDNIKLYSGGLRKDNDGKDIPQKIEWPQNLFIIGTVNIDETTYMFSPKVLDRANVIEFRISSDQMKKFLGANKEVDMKKLFVNEDKNQGGKGRDMAADFMSLSKDREKNHRINLEVLHNFFNELQAVGAEFGYRSASEIELLLTRLGNEKIVGVNPMGDNTKIDFAIMQKLLPKLHGSRNKLTKVLPILGGFCLNDSKNIKENYLDKFVSNNITEGQLSIDPNIKYHISFEKICRMYKNAVENGFASYAEA